MEEGAIVYIVPNEEEASRQEIAEYQSIIGSEMYAMILTRPDIAFTLSVLSRHLTNPSKQHIKAAKRVLRYLQGTIYLGIVYRGATPGVEEIRFHGYSDASYANCRATLRSTSGYVFFLAGGVVSHQSKRQSIVTQSSTEAEFYGLAKAGMEAL